MSEQDDQGHDLPDGLPEPVEDFSVDVEKQDAGWAVLKTANGSTSVIEHHPDEESARRQADLFARAATRYEGAHREEAIPDTYPGKGVDETKTTGPETPGA